MPRRSESMLEQRPLRGIRAQVNALGGQLREHLRARPERHKARPRRAGTPASAHKFAIQFTTEEIRDYHGNARVRLRQMSALPLDQPRPNDGPTAHPPSGAGQPSAASPPRTVVVLPRTTTVRGARPARHLARRALRNELMPAFIEIGARCRILNFALPDRETNRSRG